MTRRVVLLLGTAGAACKRTPPGRVNEYALRGKVLSLDPKTKVAVIQHEEIKGWMEAMTMEFPVRDAVEFAKLRPGMEIEARVLHQPEAMEYWIDRIREVQR